MSTATTDTNITPRIQLSISRMGGSQVTIIRVDAQGNRAPVRAANPAPLVAGAWIGWDYEAPFQVPVTYEATSNTGDTIVSPPQTLMVATPWLIHPGIPDLSRPVHIMDIGDKTTGTNQGVHNILGRSNPIVITDGTRRGATFDLILKTTTRGESQALSAILSDTSPLLLQVAYPFTSVTNYWWVSVGDVVKSTLTRDYSQAAARWTLPCTVVDAPIGLLRPQWAWADVVANYASWNAVVQAFPTWRDVITDSPTVN